MKNEKYEKRVASEVKTMAEKAAKWANSPEGQAAINKSIADAKETASILKDAEREGNVRIADKIRRLGI